MNLANANEPAILRLVDGILAHIFLLNTTKPDPELEDPTTVASSPGIYEMAVHCTQQSRDLESYHFDYRQHSRKWIETLQIPHCWILVVGSTTLLGRIGVSGWWSGCVGAGLQPNRQVKYF